LDIEPRIPLLVKVKIQEKLSPCTLLFTYEDNSDFIAYFSLTNVIPNERNCKYLKHRPAKMQIFGPGCGGLFKEKYLYVALHSKQGIRVNVTVEFSKFCPQKYGEDKELPKIDIEKLKLRIIENRPRAIKTQLKVN